MSKPEWDEDARQARLAEMCPHMQVLIEHCEAVGVEFGGCGECGSAWLDCKHCDESVSLAHEAFKSYYEE